METENIKNIDVTYKIVQPEKSKTTASLNNIHKVITDYYGINPDVIFTKDRRVEVVLYRQIFFYLAKALNQKMSYREIGEYYKNVNGHVWDHASVMHNINVIRDKMDVYNDFRREIMTLIDMCREERVLSMETLPQLKLKYINIIMNSHTEEIMLIKLMREINN